MKIKQFFSGAVLALSLMMAGCGESEVKQAEKSKQQAQNQTSNSTQKSEVKEVKSGDTISVKDLIKQNEYGAIFVEVEGGMPSDNEMENITNKFRNFYICSNQVDSFVREGNFFKWRFLNWLNPKQNEKDDVRRNLYQIKNNKEFKYILSDDAATKYWNLVKKNKIFGENGWINADKDGNVNSGGKTVQLHLEAIFSKKYNEMMYDRLCHKLNDKEKEDVREKTVIERKSYEQILSQEPYVSYKVGTLSAAEKVYPQVVNAMFDYEIDLKKEFEYYQSVREY